MKRAELVTAICQSLDEAVFSRRGLSQDLGPASAAGYPDLEGLTTKAAAGEPLALAGPAARAGSEPSARGEDHRLTAQSDVGNRRRDAAALPVAASFNKSTYSSPLSNQSGAIQPPPT